jgi:hypothetical protein
MASLNSRRGSGVPWRNADVKSGTGSTRSPNVFSFPQFRPDDTLQTTPAVVHISTVTEGDGYPQGKDMGKVVLLHLRLLVPTWNRADFPIGPGL